MQDQLAPQIHQFVVASIAGAAACALGVFVASVVPAEQFGWAGLVLIPFWLLLEVVLGLLVIIGSLPGKPDRTSVIIVVLVAFYAGMLLYPVFAA